MRRSFSVLLVSSVALASLRGDAMPTARQSFLSLHARELQAASATGGSVLATAAMVELPVGVTAESIGLTAVAPGFAVGTVPTLVMEQLTRDHPGLGVQLAQSLTIASDERLIPAVGADRAQAEGLTGRGSIVGVIDSGLDVSHPAFRNADGTTRVEWLVDYGVALTGKHPELEAQLAELDCEPESDANRASCVKDARCPAVSACGRSIGAVYARADIDEMLVELAKNPGASLPRDTVGHGSHVAGIAAASRIAGSPYVGVAPEASLIIVRGAGDGERLSEPSVVKGARFIFDRAAELGRPAVVNLSLARDLSPHDGTDVFPNALAALLGNRPGRAIVAAAGNSGDLGSAWHQSVWVPDGETVRVPLTADRGSPSPLGGFDVIVVPRGGAELSVGLDSREGRWVSPVERGRTRSAELGGAIANVLFAPADLNGVLPPRSRAAVVRVRGELPPGTLQFVLSGHGGAELYIAPNALFQFVNPVRESTMGLPAAHPAIIAVGCTVNRTGWRTPAGDDLAFLPARFDEAGGLPMPSTGVAVEGQVCSLSASGPGDYGVIKPDLLAPGVGVVSAKSVDAKPGIFESSGCPLRTDGQRTQDPHCIEFGSAHAESSGTSMSSPAVAGAIAVLFQIDPTLRQEDLRSALQAGVHRHRGPALFPEQRSCGELDVVGAALAVKRIATSTDSPSVPVLAQSWVFVNSSYAAADGSRPVVARLIARDASGGPADGFEPSRLRVRARTGDATEIIPTAHARLGPGLWEATFAVPGAASGTMVVDAVFDDEPVAAPVALPVSFDPWQSRYPATASGARCSLSFGSGGETSTVPWVALLLGCISRKARRRRAPASERIGG